MQLPTFQTVRNFRDCGGFPTRDGRTVRTGQLYRSAQFTDASDTDLDTLAGLGISAVVDFRRPGEREKAPCRRWQNFSARLVEHPGMDEAALPPHLIAFQEAGTSEASAKAAMLAIYKAFPFDPMLIELYREYFSTLADTEGALLVHCAAGKDRTGLAVALTQHMLGVSTDDIFEHFLATNQSNLITDLTIAAVRQNYSREGLPYCDEAIVVVMTVEPEYLEASFATIEARQGSIDSYLEDVLGVTPEMRARIMDKLVG